MVCRPLTNLAFISSILVKSSESIFYAEADVTPPDIWALRFSLDNKYIVTAGGIGEIDVLNVYFLRGILKAYQGTLDMGDRSKTSMCQPQTQVLCQSCRLVS